MTMIKTLGILATSSLLLLGCAGDDSSSGSDTETTAGTGGETTGETAGAGDVNYYNGDLSAQLGASGNQAKCSTCHSNDGSQESNSGNSLKDIAYHTSFKGGGQMKLIGGANACIVGWMGGTALTEDDAKWAALGGYIKSISAEDQTTPNDITPVLMADEAAYEAAYGGGDAAAGEAKYTAACGRCHDNGLVVNATAAYPKTTLAGFTVGRIAQKVRTSGEPPSDAMGPDTTPGPMPFFEEKDLSTDDLKDIIAHLKG